MSNKKIALTGDRPTGPLHLGHYVGSLKQRIAMQHTHEQFVMIADVQALTDNAENPAKVSSNVLQVALDYLAVGIDPSLTTIFIQSQIPQIAELTVFYLNLVTVARLHRNPTVKEEIRHKGFEESLPAGFFMYPVSQAADITCVNAHVVPVGHDQLPMIEQTNEIVRKFNHLYGPVFNEVEAIVPATGAARLPGIDGHAKMGKSLGNAIYLSDPMDVLKKKVMSMYTDPGHLRVEDPGQVEGNMVFAYLDIFDPNTTKVAELKAHYQRGGLGDVTVKRYLLEILEAFLTPIQERRATFAADPEQVMNMLRDGTEKTKIVAEKTMNAVRQAMGIAYF